MTRTVGGSDYGWALMELKSETFEIVQDFHLGETSSHPMNGPGMIESFKNKFLIIGGAIFDSTYDSVNPRGCILVFDKNDLGSVLTSSIKFTSPHPLDRSKPYDIGISEDHNLLITLLSMGESPDARGGDFGRMGDGHHNEIFKHSISETDGSLTY